MGEVAEARRDWVYGGPGSCVGTLPWSCDTPGVHVRGDRRVPGETGSCIEFYPPAQDFTRDSHVFQSMASRTAAIHRLQLTRALFTASEGGLHSADREDDEGSVVASATDGAPLTACSGPNSNAPMCSIGCSLEMAMAHRPRSSLLTPFHLPNVRSESVERGGFPSPKWLAELIRGDVAKRCAGSPAPRGDRSPPGPTAMEALRGLKRAFLANQSSPVDAAASTQHRNGGSSPLLCSTPTAMLSELVGVNHLVAGRADESLGGQSDPAKHPLVSIAPQSAPPPSPHVGEAATHAGHVDQPSSHGFQIHRKNCIDVIHGSLAPPTPVRDGSASGTPCDEVIAVHRESSAPLAASSAAGPDALPRSQPTISRNTLTVSAAPPVAPLEPPSTCPQGLGGDPKQCSPHANAPSTPHASAAPRGLMEKQSQNRTSTATVRYPVALSTSEDAGHLAVETEPPRALNGSSTSNEASAPYSEWAPRNEASAIQSIAEAKSEHCDEPPRSEAAEVAVTLAGEATSRVTRSTATGNSHGADDTNGSSLKVQLAIQRTRALRRATEEQTIQLISACGESPEAYFIPENDRSARVAPDSLKFGDLFIWDVQERRSLPHLHEDEGQSLRLCRAPPSSVLLDKYYIEQAQSSSAPSGTATSSHMAALAALCELLGDSRAPASPRGGTVASPAQQPPIDDDTADTINDQRLVEVLLRFTACVARSSEWADHKVAQATAVEVAPVEMGTLLTVVSVESNDSRDSNLAHGAGCEDTAPTNSPTADLGRSADLHAEELQRGRKFAEHSGNAVWIEPLYSMGEPTLEGSAVQPPTSSGEQRLPPSRPPTHPNSVRSGDAHMQSGQSSPSPTRAPATPEAPSSHQDPGATEALTGKSNLNPRVSPEPPAPELPGQAQQKVASFPAAPLAPKPGWTLPWKRKQKRAAAAVEDGVHPRQKISYTTQGTKKASLAQTPEQGTQKGDAAKKQVPPEERHRSWLMRQLSRLCTGSEATDGTAAARRPRSPHSRPPKKKKRATQAAVAPGTTPAVAPSKVLPQAPPPPSTSTRPAGNSPSRQPRT